MFFYNEEEGRAFWNSFLFFKVNENQPLRNYTINEIEARLEMINPIIKPKRGKEFYSNDHGANVYLYRIKSNTVYLICTDSSFPNDPDVYHDVHPASLVETRPARQGITSKPKKLTEKQFQVKQDLNQFFELISIKIPWGCENCGKPLYANNNFAKRSVSAHILPKAIFPTVATNENNIMFLGAGFLCICQCHDSWDANIDSRVKMKIYDYAIRKFELFKDQIPDDQIDEALKYLNITV